MAGRHRKSIPSIQALRWFQSADDHCRSHPSRFKLARKRAKQFTGVEPVRTALFCDDWVGFGIARLYESLMENTLIGARAFRDLARAADWLSVPGHVLRVKDEPAPHIETTARKHS